VLGLKFYASNQLVKLWLIEICPEGLVLPNLCKATYLLGKQMYFNVLPMCLRCGRIEEKHAQLSTSIDQNIPQSHPTLDKINCSLPSINTHLGKID
jgi:hypothetical protein